LTAINANHCTVVSQVDAHIGGSGFLVFGTAYLHRSAFLAARAGRLLGLHDEADRLERQLADFFDIQAAQVRVVRRTPALDAEESVSSHRRVLREHAAAVPEVG
jgi:hypothetical protein